MADLRFGILGMGGIGTHHAKYIASGKVAGAALTAFSSRDPARLSAASAKFPAAQSFADYRQMLSSGACDAVLIATPQSQHIPMILDSFSAGMHVLVEKPLAITVAQAQAAIDAAKKFPNLRFGIMLNQRANPVHQWLRRQFLAGTLGTLTRISWTVTHWFRPWIYYTATPWRASWRETGGGVLINQAHHQLDLLQWITGIMPRRVTAVGFLAKRHPMETEDEISAILEYETGAIGHFFASTGEFPGTNRLEIITTRARIVLEDEKLTLHRSDQDADQFLKTGTDPFGSPGKSLEATPNLPPAPSPEHLGIVQDFTTVIHQNLPTERLLAPASDGIPALELGSAMLMSGITRQPVDIPLAAGSFEKFLADRPAK
ncbi:MAG TPA: Gfo/Idh/MocA family oxidoreductase [Phycisphaerae bacterium]